MCNVQETPMSSVSYIVPPGALHELRSRLDGQERGGSRPFMSALHCTVIAMSGLLFEWDAGHRVTGTAMKWIGCRPADAGLWVGVFECLEQWHPYRMHPACMTPRIVK